MSLSITVRPADTSDFLAIYSFVCLLEEEIFDREAFRQCFDACFAMPHNHYFLAFDGKDPIGYISCHGQLLLHHCGMVYEIQELYVHEGYRSKGIGGQLIAAVENVLADSGCKLLEVASGIQRADAHRFYKNNGFSHTSMRFAK